MIHKAIEEFYVIVSSEDPLVHFGDNTGGQFRVQFPRTYHERQMGVCVIERFFCTGVRNTHQKSLRMRGFLGKLFVRRNSYQPVLQSVGILHEELTDVTFEQPKYHETKTFQFYQLEITLKDDRLRI
jgi:hypothetical protein